MHLAFKKDIVLESSNLLLKPITLSDIDNLLYIATSDKTLIQYSPKQIYTKALLTTYIENAMDMRRNHKRYAFSIFSKSDNCYVGSTSYLNIVNADHRLEIGATWIDKKFQGTGLNSECKYILLQYAFETLQAHRVEFLVDERNIRSRKAVEKIGGKLEGILREHTLMYDGFRRNTCYYSIIKSEWKAVKSRLEILIGTNSKC